MDIGNGISSAYSGYLASQASSKIDSHIQSKDYSKSSDEELLDVCKEFESYFMEQIYKEMQKTVDVFKSEDSIGTNDSLVDYFKDTALQELASTSTEREGLGLAQMLYEQMKRNYDLQ